MKATSALLVAAGAAAWLAAAGCQPAAERDDPVAETRRMLEAAGRSGAPRRAGNVLVRLERVETSADEAAGLALLWRYASGKVTVSGREGLAGGGVRAGAADADFDAELRAYCGRTRQVRRTVEEIVVLSGRRGQLWVEREALVPVLRLELPGGRVEVLENVRVGARLDAVPRVLPDGNIELEVQPAFAVLSGPRGGQTLTVESMATRVVLAPGRKIVLGARSSAAESSAAAGLFGRDSAGRRVEALVVVSAEEL